MPLLNMSHGCRFTTELSSSWSCYYRLENTGMQYRHCDTTAALLYFERLVIEILLNHYLRFTTICPLLFWTWLLTLRTLNLTWYAAYFPRDDLHTVNACVNSLKCEISVIKRASIIHSGFTLPGVLEKLTLKNLHSRLLYSEPNVLLQMSQKCIAAYKSCHCMRHNENG